jgi:dipeptidyl aminopeptidase/acylaminoacyl peptidase
MSRRRVAIFVLLAAACLAGTVVAIGSAVGQGESDAASSGTARALAGDSDGETMVLFRDLGRDGGGAGQLAVAGVDRPAKRTVEPLRCDRSYFAGGRGICLARGGGFAAGYEARVFGPDMEVQGEVDVQGIPSRARVSPDGRHGSVTLFVSGHAYAEAGSFSTQTTLIDLERGERIADLEEFTVIHGDRQVTAVDRNFWGVTFARDSDLFYATMATGGKTYLIRGSVSDRTAEVIHENVECPSLSPDGGRIAYKKRVDSAAGTWRLAVLDLETMRHTLLAETRSVDDQAEWLDGERVMYGVDGAVWTVPADGSGRPRRLIAEADSPAAIR